MTLMFEEDVDRAMVLLALETFKEGKIGCDRDFSELILIYVKQGDKKNVDRKRQNHGVYGQGDWDSQGFSFLFVLNITIESFFTGKKWF